MKDYYFLLFFCLLIAACNEPEIDVESPTITIQSISPNTTSGLVCGATEDKVIYIKSTDSVIVDFSFSDNQSLSQYKIDIHNNFDCHGHRSPKTSSWTLQRIEPLSGTQNNIREVITVPENATAGFYHFHVQLLDESGNQAPIFLYSLSIQNRRDTVPPSITLSQPTSSITTNNGNNITVQGNLTDNASLEHGKIELIYFTPSGNKSTAETIQLDANAGNNYAYTFNYTIPNSLVSGAYDFEVRAYDGVGNLANDIGFKVIIQ